MVGKSVNGTTYAGLRARTTGAPQNHWLDKLNSFLVAAAMTRFFRIWKPNECSLQVRTCGRSKRCWNRNSGSDKAGMVLSQRNHIRHRSSSQTLGNSKANMNHLHHHSIVSDINDDFWWIRRYQIRSRISVRRRWWDLCTNFSNVLPVRSKFLNLSFDFLFF